MNVSDTAMLTRQTVVGSLVVIGMFVAVAVIVHILTKPAEEEIKPCCRR